MENGTEEIDISKTGSVVGEELRAANSSESEVPLSNKAEFRMKIVTIVHTLNPVIK